MTAAVYSVLPKMTMSSGEWASFSTSVVDVSTEAMLRVVAGFRSIFALAVFVS